MGCENKMINPKYICLYNPHNRQWLLFNYQKDKTPYAPNYGTPLYNGDTPKDCITGATEMFEDIDSNDIIIGRDGL